MENKDSALLRQIQGGVPAYLMIGLSETDNNITSSLGLYNKDGEEVEGDVSDLFIYIWLIYRHVAEGLDVSVEKVHELVKKAIEDINKQTQEGHDIND